MLRLILGHVLLATTLIGANVLKQNSEPRTDPVQIAAPIVAQSR